MVTRRRERGTIMRSRRWLNCDGRPLKLIVRGRHVRIEHIAIWTRDLDRCKRFYVPYFGATAGPHYVNVSKGRTASSFV